MTNLFLKVNKDLFKIGMTPIEILIVSQVLEYQTKNMECFIGNEEMASNFGVSISTVTRAITSLKKKGFLNAVEQRTRQGTTRYLTINIEKIDEVNTKQNAESIEDSTHQNDQSALINLTNITKQNDSVKDNIKDNNIKDKVDSIREVINDSTDTSGKFKM